MLRVAGGVGGGGLFVPLLIFVGGFITKEAVPLSNCLIGTVSCVVVVRDGVCVCVCDEWNMRV
jgi:uncharacterized membrane protein YfcA